MARLKSQVGKTALAVLFELHLAAYLYGWDDGYRKAKGKAPPKKLIESVARREGNRVMRRVMRFSKKWRDC